MANQKLNKRPDFLLVVVDDMGYSDCQPFGGEIRTPRLQKLADRGVRLRNFHVSSLCAPTRAMLLSGVDNHESGLGNMPPLHATNQYLKPGYEGQLNHKVITIAEALGAAGYRCALSGKWHLGKNPGFRPEERGFHRVFSFLGGGASHFADVRPLSASEKPHTIYDEDGRDVTAELPEHFYSSDDYAEKMISYIEETDADTPFFGYLAFTAPHDPLQVPDAWLERYRGQYDGGYDAIREPRMRRMKELELIDSDLPINPGSRLFASWGELSAAQRAEQARKMEIYAAMIENADWNTGRVIDALQEAGRLDNTVIVFMSDNGANPKEPPFYGENTPELIEERFDNSLDNLGKQGSFVSIGGAWAEVANTPLSYFKTTTYEGGAQVPIIVAGPGVTRRGVDRTQLLHVCDIMPTFLEMAGVKRAEMTPWDQPARPLYGRSWARYLGGDDRDIRDADSSIAFEMMECRAVIQGGWKLLFMAPPYGNNAWRLFNLVEDPRELDDRSDAEPRKFAELMKKWDSYASEVGYIKAGSTPQMSKMNPAEFFRFGGGA